MTNFYNNFHFAPAVKDRDRLYCSGVIGLGPDGKASSDPETQFVQALESLKSVLAAAGASFANIIDITTCHVGLQANISMFVKIKDRYVKAVSRVDSDRNQRARVSRSAGRDQSRRPIAVARDAL